MPFTKPAPLVVLMLVAISTATATSNERVLFPGDSQIARPRPVTMSLATSFERAVALASGQKGSAKAPPAGHRLWPKNYWPLMARRTVDEVVDLPHHVERKVVHGAKWLACNRSRFYVEGEAWFVDRNNTAHDQALVINPNLPPAQEVIMRVSDLDFNNQAGFRTMVGFCVNECTAIEVGYLDLDLSASGVRTGNNNLAIPGDLGLVSLDFFNADRVQIDYSSTVQSLEVNFVKKFCHANLLAGFRHISLDESFNIHPNDPMTGMSDYNINTQNDLNGAQVGIEIERCRGRFGLDAVVKAGIYANDAEQSQFVMDFGPPVFFLRDFATQAPVSSSGTNAAFVGELGISGTFDLTCNLALRAGYNMMWIDGVALAANELDFTNTAISGTTLMTGGGLFLHGATFGVEGRF